MIDSLYECFKHWSEKGSVWILGDTHFNDADCLLMSPDWVTPAYQIEILTKYIHKNDTFIHLGDVGNPEWMTSIPGYKVLIMGNHDQTATKFQPYFDEIYKGALFISDKILLSHEPINGLEWCLNIHGHDHSQWNGKDKYHLNLAANVCNYTPQNLKDIIESGRISNKNITNIHRIAIEKQKEFKET